MFSTKRMVVEARRNLVSDVEAVFLPAEAASVNAATQISACLQTLMERHSAADLKPKTGVAAINTISEAAQLAVALRSKMMEAHAELVGAAAEIAFLEYFVPTCEPNEASLDANTMAALPERPLARLA